MALGVFGNVMRAGGGDPFWENAHLHFIAPEVEVLNSNLPQNCKSCVSENRQMFRLKRPQKHFLGECI